MRGVFIRPEGVPPGRHIGRRRAKRWQPGKLGWESCDWNTKLSATTLVRLVIYGEQAEPERDLELMKSMPTAFLSGALPSVGGATKGLKTRVSRGGRCEQNKCWGGTLYMVVIRSQW